MALPPLACEDTAVRALLDNLETDGEVALGGEIYAFAWMGTALASAVIASNKNRSGCLWFFLGLLAGPVALVISLILKKADPPPPAESAERS